MGIIKLLDNGQFNILKKNNKKENIKKLPLNFIKDFLFYFDVLPEDLPKLIAFSKELDENRKFVVANKDKFNCLTEKELEIFVLVVKGESSNKIGQKLFIETSTVSTHRKHIKQKLNLNSIFDWFKYAKAFELI